MIQYMNHTLEDITGSIKIWYLREEKQIKWKPMTSRICLWVTFQIRASASKTLAECGQCRLKKISLWDNKIELIKGGWLSEKSRFIVREWLKLCEGFLWAFVSGLMSTSWGKTSGNLVKSICIYAINSSKKNLKTLSYLEIVIQPEYRKSVDYLGKSNERPRKFQKMDHACIGSLENYIGAFVVNSNSFLPPLYLY